MEEEKEVTISMLPEGCISQSLSLTSPRDACRAAAVSKDFKSTADSNAVWERFLPPDYREVIARAVSRVNFASKKQLYHRLSESHIILDHGFLGFMLDKESGKKCYMLGARELSIAWEDDTRYWEWEPIPGSRFREVGILRGVCWLAIRGRMATAMLSPKTRYVAYLVYRIGADSWGLDVPGKTKVSVGGIETSNSTNVYLEIPGESIPLQESDVFCSERKDGWMEIKVGEFYCDQGDEGEVEMVFEEISYLNWKGGLLVEGIELRPT